MVLLAVLTAAWMALSGWFDPASPLAVDVTGRGEIAVSLPATSAAPDVRYSTASLTDAAWQRASVVTGPWRSVGNGRVSATIGGLPPVVHYVGARVDGNGAAGPSKVATVVPLREAAVHGNVAEGFFGHAVAMAGDVDGDGRPDLIVGAPWSDEGLESARPRWIQTLRRALRALRVPLRGGKTGAAFLFSGRPDGVAPAPAWIILGRADGEFLGSSVAGIGDVNGDGFADLAVGIPGYDTRLRDEGAVAIYYGRRGGQPTESDLLLFGRTRDESFGAVVAGVGDVDGDGYPDVAIGAPGSNVGAPNGGAVFIHHGGPAGLARTPRTVLVGRTFDGLFGSAVVGVGDVNGDGYADVLIGALEGVGDPQASGAAYLHYGGPRGLRPTPALVLRGVRGGDQFGSAHAALGDVDGDGFPDFAVAAPKQSGTSDEAGAVFIFHGGPRGPDSTPRTVLRGPGLGARFGASLAGVGDQDGDGFPDLLVGAVDAVYLFRGGPQGVSPIPLLVLRGTRARGRGSRVVAGGQDLDGDGRPDFVIGIDSEAPRGSNTGSVFVRY